MSHDRKTWGRVIVGILSLLLLLATLLIWGGYRLACFAVTPLQVKQAGQTIEIRHGDNLEQVVNTLHRRGFTMASLLVWRLLAEGRRVAGRLDVGEYALPAGITPGQLLENMASARVLRYDFTIIEGWTFRQMLLALQKAPALKHDSVGLSDTTLMQRIGASGELPEGRFLPETYAYVKGDSDLDVLRRAHETMTQTLNKLWSRRAKGLPLITPYDALILASIVEKETGGRSGERTNIAGVFIRRLRRHMPLQADPSVIYGMGKRYHQHLSKAELAKDTPYNTYTRSGLPPTPIALPGRVTMAAVLHPLVGKALYFVSRGDGTHAFASTLKAHNRNVACYQLKRCR